MTDIPSKLFPTRTIVSEHGWLFLMNDTNQFLAVQTGATGWSEAEEQRARQIIEGRQTYASHLKSTYRKFIVPEKSVIYPEYLPDELRLLLSNRLRPAQILQRECPGVVSYLDQHLLARKSLGLLYFRSDTHTNWLGAWLVYRHIVERLIAEGLLNAQEPLPLGALTPQVAAYDGDLLSHIEPGERKSFDRTWGFTATENGFESTLLWSLSDTHRRASRVAVPSAYNEWFQDRETLVYERPDRQGPRAVFFRDSTLDFAADLLAQHFSRAVFVWKHGQVWEDVLECERPDIIVHVMAERFATRYTSFPVSVRATGPASPAVPI